MGLTPYVLPLSPNQSFIHLQYSTKQSKMIFYIFDPGGDPTGLAMRPVLGQICLRMLDKRQNLDYPLAIHLGNLKAICGI